MGISIHKPPLGLDDSMDSNALLFTLPQNMAAYFVLAPIREEVGVQFGEDGIAVVPDNGMGLPHDAEYAAFSDFQADQSVQRTSDVPQSRITELTHSFTMILTATI